MERIACLVVPALPLQLLLRREPSWRGEPVVVVADDRPQGKVLYVDAVAHAARIRTGMTYAAARSLCATVRAGVVDADATAVVVEELVATATHFTPRVEPAARMPGVLWLDPSGLVPLYGSLEYWGQSVIDALARQFLTARMVVGFHRFRAYAIARADTEVGRVRVVPDARTEARWLGRVPIARLDTSPELRDGLEVLEVLTLGDLLRMPAAELRVRFGPEAAALHASASDRFAPLQARALVDPMRSELAFEPPDDDRARLLFALRGALVKLAEQLHVRSQALAALHITLRLDHAPAHETRIQPATPTLDTGLVIELVRLRLEALRLPAAVAEVVLEVEGVRATADQLKLFATQTRRDLAAADRALARLRARFGPESVTVARLSARHLPEATHHYEPISRTSFPAAPSPAAPSPTPLVRRVFARPIPLPPPPRHEPEAWLGRRGAVVARHGPYRVSGGWWVRAVERDYYFAETQHGEVLWIYYDRPRRRWMLHGLVD